MKRAWAVLVVFALWPWVEAPSVRAAPERIELESPDDIQALRRADVDGDGVIDLLLGQGRRVYGYRGRRDGLPAAKPTWITDLPDDVSFVDVAPVVDRTANPSGCRARCPQRTFRAAPRSARRSAGLHPRRGARWR